MPCASIGHVRQLSAGSGRGGGRLALHFEAMKLVTFVGRSSEPRSRHTVNAVPHAWLGDHRCGSLIRCARSRCTLADSWPKAGIDWSRGGDPRVRQTLAGTRVPHRADLVRLRRPGRCRHPHHRPGRRLGQRLDGRDGTRAGIGDHRLTGSPTRLLLVWIGHLGGSGGTYHSTIDHIGYQSLAA